MSESEVQRVYDIVEDKAGQQQREQQERKTQLREVSKARVANWPNTIEAQRLKKERIRKERLEEEEARRREIDEQEAALNDAKKEQAIRKANVLLYEENDRIKTFSSKLFLASVLDEREQQLAIKKERDARTQEAEKHWAVIEAEEKRKAEVLEVGKRKALSDRVFQLKEAQLKQLADIRARKIAERDELQAEGQRIKNAAAEAVEEEREQERRRKEGQRVRNMELVAANEDVRALRDAQKLKEEEEARQIDIYAAQKEQQMLDRKQRAEEKFTAKLTQRQKLIDRQGELLAEIKAATEERELKAMRDFDRERDEREAREAQQRVDHQAVIEKSRSQQLARKQRLTERKLAEQERTKAQWKVHADRLVEDELDERRTRREEADRHQRILLLQAHEKKQQKAHEKRLEFEEGLQQQKAIGQEQEAYEEYVNSVMHDFVVQGRKSDLVKTASRRTRTLGGC